MKINNIPLKSEKKITVLEAAKLLGINIPSLCFIKNLPPNLSCMVCIVKDKKNGDFFPSCSKQIYQGMDIDSESDEVMQLRKAAIELLLSEHVGDCSGPCESSCPFDLDISNVFDAIKNDHKQTAIALLRRDLGLPFLVNDYCSGTCEKACRRGRADKAVEIKKIIHHFLLNKPTDDKEKNDKELKILITVPGIKALALASFLEINGFSVAMPDFEEDKIRNDVELLKRTDMIFFKKFPNVQEIHAEYCALVTDADSTINHKKTFIMQEDNLSGTKQSVLQDIRRTKKLAQRIIQHFYNADVYNYSDRFVSKSGYLNKDEINSIMNARESVFCDEKSDTFNEIQKCLKCNCRGFDKCRLRQYAAEYGADRRTFKTADKQKYKIVTDSLAGNTLTSERSLSYEPGKCIRCGICFSLCKKEAVLVK